MGGVLGGFWLVALGLVLVLVLGFCFGLVFGGFWPGLGFGLGLGLGFCLVWSWAFFGLVLGFGLGFGLGRFWYLVFGGPNWAFRGFLVFDFERPTLGFSGLFGDCFFLVFGYLSGMSPNREQDRSHCFFLPLGGPPMGDIKDRIAFHRN